MTPLDTRLTRQPVVVGHSVIVPAHWMGLEIEQSGEIIHCLSEAEIAHIDQAFRAVTRLRVGVV
jgi:hypothetical protein